MTCVAAITHETKYVFQGNVTRLFAWVRGFYYTLPFISHRVGNIRNENKMKMNDSVKSLLILHHIDIKTNKHGDKVVIIIHTKYIQQTELVGKGPLCVDSNVVSVQEVMSLTMPSGKSWN